FVILHSSKEQLMIWKEKIQEFLAERLHLELHPQKSKIISLAKGIDFVGFRNFYYFKLPRKRNIRSMKLKIEKYTKNQFSYTKLMEIFKGWRAYVKWSQSYKLRKKIAVRIYKVTAHS
ncbi:MAG: hypothetical protein AABX86_01060, partial [Nanoarchaeota archaeon]